jgi:CheY-like chemotaxis protein
MRIPDVPADVPATGARVLLADDDRGVRTMFARLLRATAGVTSVVEAADGAEAVEFVGAHPLDLAVPDMNMPRLDGIDAAVRPRALQPSLQIALHSSDPELLRRRAAGHDLPLFDKLDLDRLIAWVQQQANAASGNGGAVAPLVRKTDLCCSLCGYGIASRAPPARCPMCGVEAVWVEPLGWKSRPAALDERLAG